MLFIRPETSIEKRTEILDAWYRRQLKALIPVCVKHWEAALKVRGNEVSIKKMKTKWGSCNQAAGRVWLNLELSKKPPQCIEYIIVHEMVHLLERKHNEVFIAYMDKLLPKWRFLKDELNRGPLRHEKWIY
jgi:predicted metal-dependent hydrolase